MIFMIPHASPYRISTMPFLKVISKLLQNLQIAGSSVPFMVTFNSDSFEFIEDADGEAKNKDKG